MLIPDKTVLDQYASITADFEYENLREYLFQADEEFILDPVCGIGRPLYAELVALTAPNEKQEILLRYLRTASYSFAYTLWARGAAVQHNNAGISVATGEHSAPVSDSKLEGIISDRLRTAERFLEIALGYLEENADTFSTWKNSPAYTIRKELLTASLIEFERYVYLDRSRRKFMQLRHLVLQGEAEMVAPELGEELYVLLKAHYQNSTLTEANRRLLVYAQRVVANYAKGHYEGNDMLLQTAEKHRRAMVDFLRANADSYPAWPKPATGGRSFPNDPESSQFVM